MDFNLQAMAAAAGIKVNKLLAMIEPTQALEDELYRILWPVIDAYRVQFGYIESVWTDTATVQVVQAILTTATAPAAQQLLQVEPAIEQWAEEVEAWHRRRWRGVVSASVRLDIGPILALDDVRTQVEVATKSNVNLITKLSGDVKSRIEATVWEAYGAGDTGPTLAKKLRAEFEFAKPRAKLIARDQLAKYSDALDQARALQAGLEKYKWKTVGDGVVRPTHRANNGKIFDNDKPPAVTGHPGHDVNCRCKRRQIILTDDEEALLKAEGLEV